MEEKRKTLVPTGYNPTFGVCRDVRHNWHFERWDIRGGTGTRVLVCLTCDARRTETWQDYQTVKSTYRYEKGYSLRGSRGRGAEVMTEIHRRLARLAQAGKLETRTATSPTRVRVAS